MFTGSLTINCARMRTQKAETLDTDHFGQTLRDARLKAGRSIDDISRRTKIPAPTLERIERGATAELPADVFVCGFLRAFARELGIDAEATVARYRRDTRTAEPSYADYSVEEGSEATDDPRVAARDALALREALTPADDGSTSSIDALIGKLTAKVPMLEGALGRGPAFALVVLLVVLVATITLSILLGGDPRPGQGLS